MRFLMQNRWRATLCGLVLAVTQLPCFAQTTSEAANQQNSPADQQIPAIPAKVEPFSDADWTWLNGNPRTKEIFWDSKFFTPEIRADVNYVSDFNHPTDHSIGGSSELFRSSEVQLEQLGVGAIFTTTTFAHG